jgi:P-type Cu2+ transporter
MGADVLRGHTPVSGAPGPAMACDCFHCGLPVAPGSDWTVTISGQLHPLCCPGCEAVARTIVESGLSDYYSSRTSYSNSADGQTLVPSELGLYDAPEVLDQFAAGAHSETGVQEAVFSVEGIRCAACVWLIERRLAVVPGIRASSLNVATERLHVRWNRSLCKPSDILRAVRAVGYTAYPFDAVRHGEQLQRASKTLFRQVFIAGLSMMQVMMYAVPAYVAGDGEMEADMQALMIWASLLLTIPAVFYSAIPFFRGAWLSLKARTLGMDVPVALGIAAAFIGSVSATASGTGDVYYDSITMFIFLLLCSRYLELVARRKAASALERLQHALPASAARMSGYPLQREAELIPAARLAAGDFVQVRPGESVAADCMIVEGSTEVDLSLLSGESRPQHKAEGDILPGGAVNISQAIVVRVTALVRDSALSTLVKLIERAGQAKPQLALWADRVAGWFVACLLLFAGLIFLTWQWVDPSRAWPIAIAVLVVSCPCALSMATPSALAAATERLVRQGVLVVQPHVIETLHRITHIVFDKTGTLTFGRPTLQAVRLLGDETENWCLQAAASLETASAHPLAAALCSASRTRGEVLPPAQQVTQHAGSGVEGWIEERHLRLGSARFVAEIAGDCGPNMATASSDSTRVYLGMEGCWLACFELTDALRGDARAVVQHFQARGTQVILLSGDEQGVTARVARELGIAEAHGACLPHQKLDFVQQLQKGGARVAMVGDGVNDAAVLRAADVSFAMGNGAALAQTHADTVLLSPRLSALAEASLGADMAMAVVRQNLAWATLYNVTAIPAAALGWLNPWMAGVGMAASSAIVVLNALRLRRMPKTARDITEPIAPRPISELA